MLSRAFYVLRAASWMLAVWINPAYIRAQQPEWLSGGGSWINESLAGIAVDPDGSIYAAGYSQIGQQVQHLSLPGGTFLIKFSPAGQILWYRTYSSYGILGMCRAPSGGVFLLLGRNLIQVDTAGTTVSLNSLILQQESFPAFSWPVKMQSDPAGNVYFGVEYQSVVPPALNFRILRMSPGGQLSTYLNCVGSSSLLYDMAFDSLGRMLVTGIGSVTSASFSLNGQPMAAPAANVFFLARIGSSGMVEWIHFAEEQGSHITDIVPAQDGIYVGGLLSQITAFDYNLSWPPFFSDGYTGKEANRFIGRLDTLGHPVWVRNLDESPRWVDTAYIPTYAPQIAVTPGKGIFTTAHLGLSSNIQPLNSGSIACATLSETGRLDTVWFNGSPKYDLPLYLATSPQGKLIIGGIFSSSQLRFGPLSLDNLSGNNNNDWFLASFALPDVTCADEPAAWISDGGDYCEGQVKALYTNASSGIVRQWLLNGSPMGPATYEDSLTPGTNGSYQLILAPGTACADTSEASLITILPDMSPRIQPEASYICEDSSIRMFLLNTPPNSSIRWFLDGQPLDGEEKIDIQAVIPGSYTAEVSYNGRCPALTPPVQLVLERRPVSLLADSVRFCEGSSVQLPSADLGADWKYAWIPGPAGQAYTVSQPGTYILEVSRNGCVFQDSVSATHHPVHLFIPNVITPNGDGVNESWILEGDFAGFEVMIRDRWGRTVLQTDHYDQRWQAAGWPAGVYVYQVRGRTCGSTVSGTVTVLR